MTDDGYMWSFLPGSLACEHPGRGSEPLLPRHLNTGPSWTELGNRRLAPGAPASGWSGGQQGAQRECEKAWGAEKWPGHRKCREVTG